VLNAGPAPSGAFRIAYYLSSGTQLDTAAVLLGTRSVGNVAAHAISTVSAVFTVPRATPAFDYYVIGAVDDAQAVVELQETNNALASAATVAVVPDLLKSFPITLTLTFSACSAPELNTMGTSDAVLRVTSQTGRTFSSSLTERATEAGDTITITLTFSGAVVTTGQLTGALSLVATFRGIPVLSGIGEFTGSILGPVLSGEFSAPISVITGDTCQFTGAFVSREATSASSAALESDGSGELLRLVPARSFAYSPD